MHRLIIFLALAGLLGFTGCEDTREPQDDTIAELRSLLDEDEALGLEGLDDEGAWDGEYEEGLEIDGARILADTLDPGSGLRFRFGRRITNHTRTVDFTVDGDTAYAAITHLLEGIFVILSRDTATGDTTQWNKPFTSDFHRQVRFVRRTWPNDPDQTRWGIEALTLGVGLTGSKVNIVKLEYFVPDSATPAFTFEGDVGNTFYARDAIPNLAAWRNVRVEVTVTNTGPVFPSRSGEGVLLHFGRDRRHKARRLLRDDGIWPDSAANDNVFTRVWRVHGPGMGHNRRVFRGFFDVIDFGTLYAEDETVHSAVWTLPYLSRRPGF